MVRHGANLIDLTKTGDPDLLKSASIFSILSGVTGTVIGLVQMTYNMLDPAKLDLSMGLCLRSSIYGLILCLLLYISKKTIPEKSQSLLVTIALGSSLMAIILMRNFIT